jgi:hypothetical protein
VRIVILSEAKEAYAEAAVIPSAARDLVRRSGDALTRSLAALGMTKEVLFRPI